MQRGALGVAAFLLMAQSTPRPMTVDELAWMSGNWLFERGGRWTSEQWSDPRGGVMLGYSRSGRGGALREWEFIRIAPDADGTLAYHAQPGGRAPVVFRLVSRGRGGTSVTFENPQHDFPQRIRYLRDGPVMTATISRIDGSRAMSWEFMRQ